MSVKPTTPPSATVFSAIPNARTNDFYQNRSVASKTCQTLNPPSSSAQALEWGKMPMEIRKGGDPRPSTSASHLGLDAPELHDAREGPENTMNEPHKAPTGKPKKTRTRSRRRRYRGKAHALGDTAGGAQTGSQPVATPPMVNPLSSRAELIQKSNGTDQRRTLQQAASPAPSEVGMKAQPRPREG
jgi:hypothetical protein